LKNKVLLILVAALLAMSIAIGGCGTTAPEEGEPVEVIIIIRSDSAPNPSAGNFLADKLEEVGFTVTRLLKTGGEGYPIWAGSDPNEGQWHLYTCGWISPSVPRDSGDIFEQMYTDRIMPYMSFTVLAEDLEDFPELDEACEKLAYKKFDSMAEREDLFETAFVESAKFSNQLWMCDVAGAYPFGDNVAVVGDLAGGIGDPVWVHTARFTDQEGGSMEIAMPNLLIEQWNPVAGSSWSYDMVVTRRALGDEGALPDPTTGLYWPHRLESAEVTVKTGLPVGVTHDWVTLDFADEIAVPPDAWADWDPVAQEWITAAEKYPGGATVKKRTRVIYPADIYETKLHDGSTLSIGDFVMRMIYEFDCGKEGSPVFDESQKSEVELTLQNLKGIKIVDDGLNGGQLTIDTYSDTWYLDAEENVEVDSWFPVYGDYDWTGFWHMVTVGWLAESNNLLVFSEDKADRLTLDRADYTKGDSLAVLEEQMDWAAANSFIPYEATLSAYITPTEISQRWANLQAFYDTWGHFWVGNGPYVLSDVAAVEKIVTLERFEDYNLPADWFLTYLGEDVETTRMGAFLDEVLITVETDHAAAVSRIKAGDLDIFAYAVTQEALYADIVANMNYVINYGSYRGIMCNTAGPFFAGTGKLNPFDYPEIREALNWMLDRDYIVEEYLAGAGSAKWTTLANFAPDAVERYPHLVADIVDAYPYDVQRADDAIEAVMLTIPGVTRGELDGKYYYLAP
jgi:peptide/nickel transport system substrate-binding protein